jgi:predicted ArsR family transcriptional regulator
MSPFGHGPDLSNERIIRERLLQAMRSPSGAAVLKALAEHIGGPLNAKALANKAGVSTTSARTQAWRAARLGYATETMGQESGVRPGRRWQITAKGSQFERLGTDEPEQADVALLFGAALLPGAPWAP